MQTTRLTGCLFLGEINVIYTVPAPISKYRLHVTRHCQLTTQHATNIENNISSNIDNNNHNNFDNSTTRTTGTSANDGTEGDDDVTGLNDVKHIVWATGESFFLNLVFFFFTH